MVGHRLPISFDPSILEDAKVLKSWLSGLVVAVGVGFLVFCSPAKTHADEWGRYYHWPYSSFHQYYWTPYEYQPVYDNQYRYPVQARRYPQVEG